MKQHQGISASLFTYVHPKQPQIQGLVWGCKPPLPPPQLFMFFSISYKNYKIKNKTCNCEQYVASAKSHDAPDNLLRCPIHPADGKSCRHVLFVSPSVPRPSFSAIHSENYTISYTYRVTHSSFALKTCTKPRATSEKS